jgi:SAM-dependent methyltransferase
MTSNEELRQKNKIYDHTTDSVWRKVVYEPVHGGWEFVNIGGRQILDFIGALAQREQAQDALEFCSGSGATCRYLALHYDLRLTGVEINQKQIEFAVARLHADDSINEDKITFINADVLNWQPTRNFDLAFVMDSLMLLPDIPLALGKMRRALKDNGCAIIAEVAAGPAITEKDRQLIWEFDGIVTLPTSDEYTKLLTEAGFRRIETNDRTELAVNCFQTMHDAIDKHGLEIKNHGGEQSLHGWQENTNFYLNGFKTGVFRYLQIEAYNTAETNAPEN